jgi:Mlc titration factor MtfA (ptsG expression regulator)
VLARAALPDGLWNEALEALPFLAMYDDAERARLRDLVTLFLDAKAIVGARGHEVTPLQRVIIAVQACVLVLNLDLALYDGFENVIVYPGEFVPGWEWEDEAGVVHRHLEPLAGEAMPRGPVVLSWPDVEAASDWEAAGMNLVIHEFAHKIDMRDGDANGCPPLPPGIDGDEWRDTFGEAFDDFNRRIDADEPGDIDPYAGENPGEFFAVLSEVFFAEPEAIVRRYPRVYALLAAFYRQDPARRTTG